MSDRLYRFFDSLPCRLGLHRAGTQRYPGPCYCDEVSNVLRRWWSGGSKVPSRTRKRPNYGG